MQAQMRAHAPPLPLHLQVVVPDRTAGAGGYFAAHVHAGVKRLHPQRNGKNVVDLVSHRGHKGNALQAHIINIVPARPASVIAVAHAKAREYAQPQPDIVIQLIAGVSVRRQPDRRFGGGVVLKAALFGNDGAHGGDESQTAHDMRARQLCNARRIIGQSRDVIGAPHHAARQRHAPGAPFIEGESLGQNH